jgi:aryl-alcohol dehydrogenase-like predicted oxidoreductase
MEYRQLGRSGLKVPVLSLGTGTFGGTNEFFQRWGQTDVAQAKRMIDLCLDSGLSFFDTADVYSDGVSEEILGQGLKGRRQKVLISTKATFAMGEGENDVGSSRYHLIRACEASLKRLNTDYNLMFISCTVLMR